MRTTTLDPQGLGVCGLQVHPASRRNAAHVPARNGRGLDVEMLGGAGQSTEVADDADGLGVAGLLGHDAILVATKDQRTPIVSHLTNGKLGRPTVPARTISGMTTTFSERLKLATQGLPRGVQARLAAACDVSPPSVNAWFSGDTKTIAADVIFPAARFLKVNPEWLATGRGSMHPASEDGVSDSGQAAQAVRLDPEKLRLAMRFAKAYLVARDMDGELENHPSTLSAAYAVVERLDGVSEPDLIAVMARMAANLRGLSDGERSSGGRTGTHDG